MYESNGRSEPDEQSAGATVEVVWGPPSGLGPQWQGVPSGPGVSGVIPPRVEVEEIYGAAAAEPPLHEAPKYAALFADVYDVSVRHAQVVVAAARSQPDGRLCGFAYGHHWRWEEQKYPWAFELQNSLGAQSVELESTFALNLLARDPRFRAQGIGRRTLEAWLEAVTGYGCWLQTSDIGSPARRLYESLGFTEFGYGPEAPNGQPGLVMFRLPE